MLLSNISAARHLNAFMCVNTHMCYSAREATACFDIWIEFSPAPLAPLRNPAQMNRLFGVDSEPEIGR